MRDQAAMLRAAAPARDGGAGEAAGAIVVGSGKGGVGKSTLSVLIAASLARAGHRTLLVDGAQNMGNLHILLGVRPATPLAALHAGEAEPGELVMPVAERLALLPGDSGAESLYALGAIDRARLHHRLSTVFDAFDRVVVDGGPGLESVVRAAGIRASRLVVLTAPEPAALADAYALLKIVNLQLPAVPLEVMVNRVSADEEGQAVFERLNLAADRFLRRTLAYLGCVREDEAMRMGSRRPGALLEMEHAGIDAIAARLGAGAAADADGSGTDTRGLAA
jgi:flagellar biosynthesis protein FlhG